MTPKTTAQATTHCGRCHRLLSDPKAVARGYGRTCWAKVQEAAKAAALTESTTQVDKAVELIEDGGLVHLRRGVYQTVSTDGQEIYLTAANTCTCLAGLRGRTCYHQQAVRIVAGQPTWPSQVYALPGAPAPVERDPFWNIPSSYADTLDELFAA
jgi:hypothetical protein